MRGHFRIRRFLLQQQRRTRAQTIRVNMASSGQATTSICKRSPADGWTIHRRLVQHVYSLCVCVCVSQLVCLFAGSPMCLLAGGLLVVASVFLLLGCLWLASDWLRCRLLLSLFLSQYSRAGRRLLDLAAWAVGPAACPEHAMFR